MTDRDTSAAPDGADLYEPPTLLEVGEFCEDTLGFGSRYTDFLGEQGWG